MRDEGGLGSLVTKAQVSGQMATPPNAFSSPPGRQTVLTERKQRQPNQDWPPLWAPGLASHSAVLRATGLGRQR